MKQILRRALLCALAGAAGLYTAAAAVVQPTEARYVADYAQVLSEDTEQYIIEKNQALFSATGGEIVVVAVDFMDGMDAADYAMSVAENWGGIGDVDRANGFVLVYAVGENKVWALAGAGIEDALPASTIEGWLEDDFYDGYDAGEYDSATRAFFDDVYGWYESYYAGSAAGGGQGYYPAGEPDYVYGVPARPWAAGFSAAGPSGAAARAGAAAPSAAARSAGAASAAAGSGEAAASAAAAPGAGKNVPFARPRRVPPGPLSSFRHICGVHYGRNKGGE